MEVTYRSALLESDLHIDFMRYRFPVTHCGFERPLPHGLEGRFVESWTLRFHDAQMIWSSIDSHNQPYDHRILRCVRLALRILNFWRFLLPFGSLQLPLAIR